jgi:hypothetical protein
MNLIILKFVVASAAEAELGALFHNCQEGIIFRQTLSDMGHPQPKIPVHCDNVIAVGLWVLEITPSNANNCGPWRCVIFGSGMRLRKICMLSVGTQVRRTLLTTKANTTWGHTIKLCALGICIRKIP